MAIYGSGPIDDVRLPPDIEQGSLVGPSFSTTIVPLSSGAEQRNADWMQERVVADISYGVMRKDNPDDVEDSFQRILRFYRARRGRWRGFRFRDWSDFEVVDEDLVMLDHSYARLTVRYEDYLRTISRPVFDTIKIDGFDTADHAFQLLKGGLILFNSPQSLTTKKVSFEFDIPMRFDADMAQVNLTLVNVGEIPQIQLIQIPDPPDPNVLLQIARGTDAGA